MKYVKQFGIILLISFAGEALNYLLPLPVPASIYGLVLMFLCLQLRVFRLEDVRDTALFLIEIMPLMFIPAATGLMTSWGIIRAKLFAYLAIAAFYAVTVSGHIKSTIPLLLLLILAQWVGIFLTTFSTILTNLLAGLFFFVALASWVMKLADGGEVLKMLITAFVVFVLPYIAIAAIAKISFFAEELRDFLQS